MTAEEAERTLRGPAASVPPLVLAAGPDEFLRERIVRAFREGATREGAEFARLEGDELPPAALAGALTSLALFGSALRIWIREGAKLESAAEDTLLAWADGSGEGVRVLVTTARERGELKWLGTLASRGVAVDCVVAAPDTRRWAERLAEEERVKLPAGGLEALAQSASDLLALAQELRKLAVHADAQGRIPASSLDALRGARLSASLDRWAQAVLARDRARALAERPGLSAAGVGGTAALWAVAECALAALEPAGFAYGRATPRASLTPLAARAALDAVYRADRSLKRGIVRDVDLMDYLEQEVRGSRGG